MHMLILLSSVCCLLEEIIATCYMKLSGATVTMYPAIIFKLRVHPNIIHVHSHWDPRYQPNIAVAPLSLCFTHEGKKRAKKSNVY